ncbi:mycothiol-dependent nitroreductase Rv2466c family protein [Streptomyces sp. NPDC002285]
MCPSDPDSAVIPNTASGTPTHVDLWCDPICPWAWVTAQWLLEVRRHRPITLTFRVMSLSILNDGRPDLDVHYRLLARHGWGPARLCIAAEQHFGSAALARLYQALARRFHDKPVSRSPAALREALAEAQLPSHLVEAATSTAYDEALRTSHQQAMTAFGADTGTPLLRLQSEPDTATTFFGPVLDKVPLGSKAVILWDGLLMFTEASSFRELRRHRALRPSLD